MPYVGLGTVPSSMYLDPASIGTGSTGTLTATQRQGCEYLRAWLAQRPAANTALLSAECGVCPTVDCPESDCLTPEEQGYILPGDCPLPGECLSPGEQGYILPGDCPATGEPKAEKEAGWPWWWLLLAAGGGTALGFALGSKKKAAGV